MLTSTQVPDFSECLSLERSAVRSNAYIRNHFAMNVLSLGWKVAVELRTWGGYIF